MRLGSIITATCLSLLGTVWAACASAATIGVPQNLGPWGLNANLPPEQRGLYANLAEALAASTSIPIDIKFVPYGRMLQGVKSGELDYAFGLVTPSTTEAAPFTTIIGKVPMIAIARKGLELKSLEDLRKLKEVGFLRGGSCGPVVDGDPAVRLSPQDGYETAIRKMAAGRLDGWCSIKAGFDYALSGLNMKDQMGDQIEYGAIRIGFQVTAAKMNTAEANELSAALERLVSNGTAGQIFTRYLGAPYQP